MLKNAKEENPKIILTDALEIYIIELSKGKELMENMSKEERTKNSLNTWLQFINNPEAVVDMDNKEVKKAKEVLEEISKDEDERYKVELRQKYIMDQKATEAAGYDKGLEAGIKQGLEQGARKEKLEIAKNLLNMGLSIEQVIKATRLNKEEIDLLKNI